MDFSVTGSFGVIPVAFRARIRRPKAIEPARSQPPAIRSALGRLRGIRCAGFRSLRVLAGRQGIRVHRMVEEQVESLLGFAGLESLEPRRPITA